MFPCKIFEIEKLLEKKLFGISEFNSLKWLFAVKKKGFIIERKIILFTFKKYNFAEIHVLPFQIISYSYIFAALLRSLFSISQLQLTIFVFVQFNLMIFIIGSVTFRDLYSCLNTTWKKFCYFFHFHSNIFIIVSVWFHQVINIIKNKNAYTT